MRPPPPAGRAWPSLVLPGLGLAAVAAGAVLYVRSTPAPIEPARRLPPARVAGRSGPTTVPGPPPTLAPAEPAPSPEIAAALEAARAAAADRETAGRLADRVRARAPLSAEDVRQAEALYARYPAPARDLLEAVLIGAAASDLAARRTDAAAALLERARVVAPLSTRGLRALLALREEAGEWAAAEAVARQLLALRASDTEAAQALAYALVRQDRSSEAVEFLAAFLEATPDPATRQLLERIRQARAPEAALAEARIAHFHVRYDGEAHEDVGREILRVADRHYATLVRTFDHEPTEPIPVVLLSHESYYDATGAPAWSGGLYDSFDGRVRIPIAGLTASLAQDLDETLLHELTHAFVAELSHGVAPREIQEGLAQLMEGKRAETLAGEAGLRALADGRLQGVRGFYLSALSLVEDLVAQRGQGGINDLLKAMAETGQADEAFRRVYGKDLDGLRRDWAVRLRQRYGS
ncbi:MAG TPA: hypothetical protein VMT70_16780 [Vicinamibacteria bacterium]|nr:hypothetical protein [Vicinamibacteria bacterium]